MKNPVFRIAFLYAVLVGGFILLDLTMDRLIGGPPGLDRPHLILAAVGVLFSFILLSRALEVRNRAEAVVRQAYDELEIRVHERTAELVRANEALQAEIVERKQAEERLAYQAHLLKNVRDAIVATDERLVITAWNRGAEETYGWKAQEALGRSVTEMLRSELAGDQRSTALREVTEVGHYYSQGIHHHKDGRPIYVEAHTIALRDANGRITGYVSTNRDTTDRQQAEEALRQSEEKYRTLFETMVQGVVYQDAAGKIISANPAAERILGLTFDQMQGRTFMDPRWRAIHEDGSDFPGETHPAMVALQMGAPVKNVIMGVLDPQAQECRWININAVPQFKPGEKRPYQVYATLENITERKQAEEELRETRDYLENLFNYANAPIIVWDPEFRITRFNHAFERLTGRGAAEVLGQQLDILFPAGRRDEALDHIRRTVAGERWEVVEIPILRVDDTVRTVLWNSATLYAPDGTTAVATIAQGQDITEPKRAEEELRQALEESRQRQAEVSALLAGSRAVLEHREFKDAARAIFDACKNLMGATGGYVSLLSKDGTRNEPLLLDPGNLPCTVDPALPMPIRGLREQVYHTGQAVYDNDFSSSEWTQLLPDGHVCLDNVLFAPLAIQGIVVGLIGLANKPGGFTDNDARLASAFGELAAIALSNRRTRVMLENSEEHFRSVAQSANDAIITLNSQWNIVFWNHAAETIFGYPAAEMMGKPFTRIMPRQDSEAHEDQVRRALATGRSALIGKTIEATGLRKDGGECPIELSFANWETKEGIFFTSTIRDITERKQSEAALRQTQDELARRVQERTTLEERQRLARELHDSVSQALYGISLGTHTALTLFDTDRAKVLEALNYVLSLTQAGLTEMRSLIFELRPESLAIEGLVVALGKHAAALRARRGIEVELALCDEPDAPLPVKEAIYRIAQEALQNAVKHARSERLDVRLRCGEESIGLEVCDNGVGFDPLASYPGHLGLRSMRERASSVGGTLEIESVPGCGTRIRAHVPIRAIELTPSL